MAPYVTLYILGGCVAVAAALFIVMIVLSVLRPPQLPDITIHQPPLQRMMRALTPVPFATPAGTPFEPAPTMRAAVAPAVAPPVAPAPVRAPSPPPAPSPPRAPAPSPSARPPFAPPSVARSVAPAYAPSIAPSLPARPVQPQPRVRPPLAKSPISLPVYPARRSRTFVRIVLGLFVTSALAAGAVVAYPAMLDPLCDDYEWFGAEATSVVRQHARDAHAAIAEFVATL